MSVGTGGRRPFDSAVVIGAGTMGAGIAAHLANAGLEVELLDLTAELAAQGLARAEKAGAFMDPSCIARVSTGTLTASRRLASADLVVEAVAERLDVKRALFATLESAARVDAVITSNTSTIPLAQLVEGRSAAFAWRFLITHFFNPPRRMRLLELVSGPRTDPHLVDDVEDFCQRRLGKRVVHARDTPGFIANRIGLYWMAIALHEAIDARIAPDAADAALTASMGVPSTGVFGLYDLVGLDLMPQILGSLAGALGPADPVSRVAASPPVLETCIREGRLGRKSGAGFYRQSRGRGTKEVLDLDDGTYRPSSSPGGNAARETEARTLLESAEPVARFASAVIERTLAYAIGLVPEIAASPVDVDVAMREGFGWRQGPFELTDRLGTQWLLDRLRRRAASVPPLLEEAARQGGFHDVAEGRRRCLVPGAGAQPVAGIRGALSLTDLALRASPLDWTPRVSLWSLGDGVGLLELRTKMNVVTAKLLDDLNPLLDRAEREFQALLVGGDAPNFCAGADLRDFLAALDAGPMHVENFLLRGQALMQRLKYLRIPVVAAVRGWTLGGGCELALHCGAIQAHAEASIGLVEAQVGVIPAWGGCKEMLLRVGASGALDALFDRLRTARSAACALQAHTFGYLRGDDGITMNSDLLLADARQRALQLVPTRLPPQRPSVVAAGAGATARLVERLALDAERGVITAHDARIGERLAHVLTGGGAPAGGRLTEEEILRLEREAFLELVQLPETQARIRHLLETGKPLRN